MRRMNVATIDDLRAASVADIGAFWQTVVKDLGIDFHQPYRQIVDTSRGIAHAEWFVGGGLNAVDACLAKWVTRTPNATAVIHEAEDGTVPTLSSAELAVQVAGWGVGLPARRIR